MIPLSERCLGKWRDILLALDVHPSFLTKRNGPCPMCGGKDRWRWTNYNDAGCWVCNQCGRGDGIELVMRLRSLDFKGALNLIETVIGQAERDVAPRRSRAELLDAMRAVWSRSQRVTPGCPVDLYLHNRGICLTPCPPCIRYVPRLWHDQGYWPAMVAKIVAPDGTAANLHRTWITEGGLKAPVEPVRKTMAGEIPRGSAVRLSEPGRQLGIAEGIETALRAGARFDVPTWAVIAEGNMQGFFPPVEVEELLVFGDADPNYVGQAAAYATAKAVLRECRRIGREMAVRVLIPDALGTDWADDVDARSVAA